MNTKIVTVATILFIVLIAGMFVYANLKKNEITTEVENDPVNTETPAYSMVERITAKHFFVDGVHTIAGEIELPTPCDLLTWDSTVAESSPEQVTIDFSVINTSEMCAQVITAQRFKEEFSASENASINATFMGRSIELNLVPAAEGETPDDFELFIKG